MAAKEATPMTTKTRICTAVAMAVVFFATLNANAQSQQALGISLLGSSIETQSDSLTLISEVFLEAFPSFVVPCPKTATKGCTLRIDVSAVYQDSLASGAENIMVTVSGANLPPVDPSPTIPIDGIASESQSFDARSFRWMQRNVSAGATVTVTIGAEGGGSLSYRTATVDLFKN
jgi:hypothetical protein